MQLIKAVLVIFFLLNNTVTGYTQELDIDFGNGGKVITNVNPSSNIEAINAIISLQNQKIIDAGSDNTNAFIIRYNNDGSIDGSFQNNGFLNLPFKTIVALFKKSENEIYFTASVTSLSGNSYFVVGKMDNDGNLDSSFGLNGLKTLSIGLNTDDIASAMTIQVDGKIIIVGNTSFGSNSLSQVFIVRLLPDGNYDTTFNSDGIFTLEMVNHRQTLFDVSITNDNKIVASGQILLSTGSNQNRMCVLRLLPNGNLDTSFANTGYKFFNPTTNGGSTARSHITLDNGNIILGGYAYTSENLGVINNFTLVKLDENGNFDSSFGNNGVVVSFVPSRAAKIDQITIDENLNIYAAGYSEIVGQDNVDFTLSKYNSVGNLISDFGTNGFVYTDINGYADFLNCILIENNKILTAGTTTVSSNPTNQQCVLVRYNYNSSLNTFEPNSSNNDFLIYPVIFTNQLNIKSEILTNANLSIYDYSGRMLFIEDLKISHNAIQLDFSFLAKGNYLLKIKSGKNFNENIYKIIKK